VGSKVVDYTQGSVITSPPTVAKNVVITGYRRRRIRRARRRWWGSMPPPARSCGARSTVPLPRREGRRDLEGRSGKYGGAVAWHVGSYDPKLNLVYYGTSNPSPWSAVVRGNDSSDIGPYTNLYSASVLAINPEDGKIQWHYQFTPHDAWDYDGVNELVFADLPFDGSAVPVIMQANRNGFFYVLDRANGKLLSAKQFVDGVNWATGIDMKTGMPIEAAATRSVPA
jgi:glucose dehydrogenase